MKKLIAALTLTAISVTACNTSAIPGECLQALEDHNVPEEVIELVKEKAGGDLNFVQRAAVRLAFEQDGVGAACGNFAE